MYHSVTSRGSKQVSQTKREVNQIDYMDSYQASSVSTMDMGPAQVR